jgi:hypothetical protein
MHAMGVYLERVALAAAWRCLPQAVGRSEMVAQLAEAVPLAPVV